MLEKSKKNLSIALLAPLVAAIVAMAAIYYSPLVGNKGTPLIDLSKSSWKTCFGKFGESSCHPIPRIVPSDITALKEKEFKDIISYETSFVADKACLTGSEPCSLFMYEVGDSAIVSINGKTIGTHGQMETQGGYAKHYPLLVQVPPEILNADSPNELRVTVYSFKTVQAGIRAGPIGIFKTAEARGMMRSKVFQNIFLPVLCASLLVLIGFFLLVIFKLTDQATGIEFSLIGYIASSALFLFSFSELPREVFPVTAAGYTHFFLRLLNDFAFFSLVTVYFNYSKKLKMMRVFYLLILASYPVMYFYQILDQGHKNLGFDNAYFVTRLAFPLLMLPHMLGIWGGFFKNKSKAGIVLGSLLVITLGLQIHDSLVFHALIQGSYFVKFYPLILGIVFSTVIFREKMKSWVQRQTESEAKHMVAKQVAHDIRSPLEVLKGLKQDILILPEGPRRRLQMSTNRIEEIANNLLKNKKESALPDSPSNIRSEEILSVLTSILLEKQIEYSTCPCVEITDSFDSNSYGNFSQLRSEALKRVISNLVNNGVEALIEKRGKVEIKLYSELNWNVIEVSDTGSGIPDEFRDKIFQNGFTSKVKGHGLGLSAAMEEVTTLGGRIEFESKIGSGTTFKISLPKSDMTPNFVKSIEAYKFQKIIVLDDDPAFHEVWAKRLKIFEGKVENFLTIKDFFNSYSELPADCLLLSDFELLDGKYDGIDVIQKYGVQNRSVLITARSEEEAIQKRCATGGIKLLSKSVINYVQVQPTPPHVVLIDDDKLMRIVWKAHFEAKGIAFKSFTSVDGFLDESSSISKETMIYIDSDLGNGSIGEVDSEKIFALGFPNLYLATGYQKDGIQKPHWIKDIYSKNPNEVGH